MDPITELPEEFTQGDRLLMELRLGYDPEEWDVTLAVESDAIRNAYDAVPTTAGKPYARWDLTPTQTREWQPGGYVVTLYATIQDSAVSVDVPTGTRVTIARQRLNVLPDPSVKSSAAVELRSYNQIVLDNLKAAMVGKASKDQLNFAVNGTSISRYSLEEVQQLINEYRWLVHNEEQRERMRQGRGNKNLIRVRH